MNVYYVERRGVSRRGVLGVFATEEEAKACAEAATNEKSDGDGYHDFVVVRVALGERILTHNDEEHDVLVWWAGKRGAPYQWRSIP